jgi:methylmalonyl-CoA mutase
MRRVASSLKGAALEERLVSLTSDDIPIEPIYGAVEGPHGWRSAHTPWTIVQRCDHLDPVKANAQAREDLANGATGLSLIFGGAASAHGFGLIDRDSAAIGRALKDIRLDQIALRLEPGPDGRRIVETIAQWLGEETYDPERLLLSFGMDPIGSFAAHGHLAAPFSEIASRLHGTVKMLQGLHFGGPFVAADGRIWNDGGASEAQELAFVMATGVAYLRALENVDDLSLARAVSLALSADQDMFLTLAKFRAARLLWGQILSESRLPSSSLTLHGETSWRMMTARDPHTNILRATAAVFGAALGGADSVAVLPFSAAQGLPDIFARRIARNIQLLLVEETNLWRVADAGSGAGYIEHMTQSLAGKAWDLFRSVERAGGIVNALQTGFVQSRIAEQRAKRQARGEKIVGTTDFTAATESPPSIEPADRRPARKKSEAALSIDPIPAWRISEAFEGLAA